MEIDKKIFEIEFRGVLNEGDFMALQRKLVKEAASYEEDDKISYFFVVKGFVLKITDEISKNGSYITLKIGHETGSDFEEIDIAIPRSSVIDSLKLFNLLGYKQVNKVPQKRSNYFLNDSVIASLKITPDFGYHFEVETAANGYAEIESKKAELLGICRKYGLSPLSNEQMAAKIEEINLNHNFNQYGD